MSAAVVTSSDRFTFTLFLALMLHAIVVLGVTFEASDASNQFSKTLEVTLASFKSDRAPDEADFLAQENQQGSGTLDEARMLTTDNQAMLQDNAIKQTSLQEQAATAPQAQNIERKIITTEASSSQRALQQRDSTPVEHDLPDGPKQHILQLSMDMASLEAKLEQLRQTDAKRPRVQRLTAASTMKASDASYVNSWRQRIEDNGARNYPREAENCFNNCRLRLLVSINANGTIRELVVLESSGRKVLDDAALRIVRLSAPFAPFSEEMKKETDVLEIIRTWQFKGNRYLSDAG